MGGLIMATAIAERMNSPVAIKTFSECLPSHVSAEAFAKQALIIISGNEKLMKCSVDSLYQAVLQVARLGLSPDPQLGMVSIVPYKDKCSVIIGYKGMIELAMRTGKVRSIKGVLVHQADLDEGGWSYEEGSQPRLYHKPALFAADRGEIVGAYARVQLKDGSDDFEIMRTDEIEAIRNRTFAWQKGYDTPWKTDPGEMMKKTAIRRLCKRLDLSTEFRTAMAQDQENEFRSTKPLHAIPGHIQAQPLSLAADDHEPLPNPEMPNDDE